MEETSMNLFDLGVLIIVGLSALLSFYRGFIREVLSLGGWIVASIVTLRYLEPATEYIRPQIGSAPIAVAVASVGLFIITLILFSILTRMVIKFLKLEEKVGLLDNLAGLCFGVARGALMVTIGFFIMSKFFSSEENLPKSVREAASRPYVEQCAKWLGDLMPGYLDKMTDKKEGDDANETNPDDSKKHMNELIQKWDKKAKDSINDITPEEDMSASSLPSIEDLQNRIRQENEKR
jgi:membrane protein required for colicin V production